LSDILAESTYMSRLIGDLLTLARSGEEEAWIPMELLELNDSVRAIVERAQALAATRNISLACELQDQVVPLRGNQNLIERMLMILIDNAVRYTPSGGRVWIESWVTSERCGFLIRDTGIGISKADHERIFERFFRVDLARTPRDGGSGLGLSIAKSLAGLHGGTIRVESELGAGSSFEVAFARADVQQTVAEPQSIH